MHTVAMCNMAELAGRIMTDVSVAVKSRWLPVGMTMEYLKKATNTIAIPPH
ncbi:DUF4442 domain-containing protein [Photobacterium chitinilyticum]|uniref:DUF4442 domain-containing protein n=1 Tax=Photobacterium chitinilyticum TaxID=2485123 RepID=UPI0022797230|nr:DUF4442 domain-containing protein [Photobacterium chitinilyticum]